MKRKLLNQLCIVMEYIDGFEVDFFIDFNKAFNIYNLENDRSNDTCVTNKVSINL